MAPELSRELKPSQDTMVSSHSLTERIRTPEPRALSRQEAARTFQLPLPQQRVDGGRDSAVISVAATRSTRNFSWGRLPVVAVAVGLADRNSQRPDTGCGGTAPGIAVIMSLLVDIYIRVGRHILIGLSMREKG